LTTESAPQHAENPPPSPGKTEPSDNELDSMMPWYLRWFHRRKRRANERYPLQYPTQVRCESWAQFLQLYTQNISQGGIFLQATEPPPIGATLQIQIELPSGQGLVLSAQVVHVVAADAAAAQGVVPGFGAQFVNVTEEQIHALRSLVEIAQQNMAAPPVSFPAK
jgi:uncharacterized protein (TIGR02266 family)